GALAGRPRAATARPPLPRGGGGGSGVTALAVVAGSALAVLAVLFVARPFLREPSSADDRLEGLDAAARRRLELAEERDRALAALKELELDHRTGKLSDEDYRALVGSLRRRAAEALRALEPRSGTGADVEAQAGAKIHARR